MKTLTRICTILGLGALASAASAIDYNSVFIESEMNVIDANVHQEEVFIGQEDLVIDFGLKTFEFLNLSEGILSRSMNFNDTGATGLTLGFNTGFDTNDCDQGETPPCTEPFTLLGNYITSTGSGDTESSSFSALTTTNREFFTFLSPDVETFGPGAFVADMGMGIAVEPPTTLALADITGNYFVVSKWTGFLSNAGNYSAEFGGLSLVDFTFNGNGGCTGSVVDSELEQSNSWPDLGTRASVRVATDSDVFTGCSYTVNAGSGTVSVTLTTLYEGEPEVDVVTLFVSSGYRFLVTRQAGTEVDGTETYYEGAMILAVKQASSASNDSLSGTYLAGAHVQTHSVTVTGTGGVEADSLFRMAYVFNADEPDVNGYSTCDVTSSVYALAYRAMGGRVDLSSDYQVSDILNESQDVDFCRYRVASDGTVDLETSEDGVDWTLVQAALSDDHQALIGGGFNTDADPLVPGTNTFLLAGESAGVGMFVAVKLNAGANTQAVLDDYARLMLPSGGTKSDFSNDGNADILFRKNTGSQLVWTMNGATRTSTAIIGGLSTDWTVVAIDDFDNDGDADILYRDLATGRNQIWTMNGTTRLSANLIGLASTNYTVTGTGDFNNDGNADILFRSSAGSQLVWTMNGSTRTSTVIIGGLSTAWTTVAVDDFDGDGDADILYRDLSTGRNQIWTMNGTTRQSANLIGLASINYTVSGTGDFNNDGNADILFRSSAGSQLVWTMNGSTRTSTVIIGGLSTAWTTMTVDDYDGDGDADILYRDLSTGRNQIWTMNGTTRQSADLIGLAATSFAVQPE